MTSGDVEPGMRTTIVLSGESQTLRVPFDARVVGTGAAETVTVASGASVRFGAGDGDAVALPGRLADFSLGTAGNALVAEGAEGTSARVALNGGPAIRFDDGSARAGIGRVDGGTTITLDGEAVGGGIDPAAVTLDTVPGGGSGGTRAPNGVFLDGGDQRIHLPFDASVVGTGASETVRIASGVAVSFTADTGDRVELPGALSAYDVSSGGNQLVLDNGATRASVSLNGEATLAFADGSADAGIEVGDDGLAVTLGGVRVDGDFDADGVTLDENDATAPVSADSGELPPVPKQTGRGLVHTGTPDSDLIEGNRNLASADEISTIRGNGGRDRFVFDNDPTEVAIADFAPGDQLFFTDSLSPADVSVGNGTPEDGAVQVFVGEDIRVDLTNLNAAQDAAISDVASLREAFGENAIAFGESVDTTNTTPGATAPLEVSFAPDTDGFFDGMRSALTDTLAEAWDTWAENLEVAEGADVELELRETGPEEVGNALAATQSIVSPDVPSVPTGDVFIGREVHLPGVTAELRTGTDPNGDEPDVVMGLQESSFEQMAFERGPDGTIPEGQFDALTVLTHELGHALAFDGSINVGPERADGVASAFDQHIRTDSIGGSGFEFDGPNVRAVNDGPVSFGASDPYHIGVDGDLMVGGIRPNETLELSRVDLAILADAGVPVSDSALSPAGDDPVAIV